MENKNVRYILDNIISKAKYNEETNTYEITEEDYINLNLTSKQKSLLKKMCDKLGIKIEYTRYTKNLLPAVEDEELFEEYNQILDKLESATDDEFEKLEQRKIELRNKIWIDNIDFVNAIIERRINKLDNLKDIEDITQTAYEILLEYIDNNYLYKGIFKDKLSKILILYTTRKILYDTESIGENTKNHLEDINKAKEEKEIIDLEELSKITNLSIKRIEELLKIENIVTPSSLEEQISLTNSQKLNNSLIIYDDTFENLLMQRQRESIISKIILTLPKIEQEILILYFGLQGKEHTQVEIAKMYGTTKSYISLMLKKALDTIKESARINCLKEIYEVPETYQDTKQISNKHLEEFLIRNLPPEAIESIKPYLDKKTYDFLDLYTKEKECTLKELSKILHIPITKVYKLKEKTLSSIRYIILNQLNQNKKEKTTYEEYVNYLLQLWMHKGYVKRKVR